MIDLSPATGLPVPVPPQPDEAFSSWLVRLANAHGLRTRSLCSLLTCKAVEFNRDLDGAAGGALLALVCACLGRDLETMRATHTLEGFGGRLFAQAKSASATPWVLPTGPFYQPRPAMQFCPACLREGTPYYRRSWRLSLLGVCPAHGLRLHHVCPACAAPVNFIRSQMDGCGGTLAACWHCGADARRAPAVPAEAVDVRIGGELLAAAQGGGLPPGLPPGLTAHDYFVVLGMLCSRLLGCQPRLVRWREQAARGAGSALPPKEGRSRGTAFDRLADPVGRLPVLRTARWLLEDWPSRFLEAAKAADTRASDFAAHFAACPEWFLKPLQTRLTPPRSKPAPTPGLLRVERMREFLLARRYVWYPRRLPRLARSLRAAGFYSPETDERTILLFLPGAIARLRAERKDYHLEMSRQVPRGTPQWSHLILRAKPYRKEHCSDPARLRRGILALCAGQFLSGRDLSDLLRRSQSVLVCRHLIPMAREGQLETRFPINQGGVRANPRQAYRKPSEADGGGEMKPV